MTHVNHQRNYSLDSKKNPSQANHAALRGALLAFAKPQSALQNGAQELSQRQKAATAASSLAVKKRPEVKQPVLAGSISSYATSQRTLSPSRSFSGERYYERQGLAVSTTFDIPRTRSPLGATAASIAASRASPWSCERRHSSVPSGVLQVEASEHDEVEEQLPPPRSSTEVKVWLDNLQGPTLRPRVPVRTPFRRGMTLRGPPQAPTGTAVTGFGSRRSPSVAVVPSFMELHNDYPQIQSPQPVRTQTGLTTMEIVSRRPSPGTISTDLGNDATSEYDTYEHSEYARVSLEQPVRNSSDSGDYDSSGDSSSEHDDDDDDETLRNPLSMVATTSTYIHSSEQLVLETLVSAPVPSSSPSRLSLVIPPQARPTLGPRPKSFISVSSATRTPLAHQPRAITPGTQIPTFVSTGSLTPYSPSVVSNRVSTRISSTRAPSRVPSPLKSPPAKPSLHRRHTEHGHSRSFSHRPLTRLTRRPGRSPSPTLPPKIEGRMMQTLRKMRASSSDEDRHKHHHGDKKRHRFHIRKAPNKHHEGDRKRWRNEITPRESKRYEGVWAANRGLLLMPPATAAPAITTTGRSSMEQQDAASAAAAAAAIDTTISTTAPPAQSVSAISGELRTHISNLIARDIWSRSRLPFNVLEEVWDLVDQSGLGRLSKEQFIVGMWLIDQRLKGRKLPVKVSYSVWASARGMYGLKMPKLKNWGK